MALCSALSGIGIEAKHNVHTHTHISHSMYTHTHTHTHTTLLSLSPPPLSRNTPSLHTFTQNLRLNIQAPPAATHAGRDQRCRLVQDEKEGIPLPNKASEECHIDAFQTLVQYE